MDLETGILWNFKTPLIVGKRRKQRAWFFYQMETKEVSDRFVAPCFVNGLEAYDGEINLGVEENMISNEYAVKLCSEHEVKRGKKVVKKELIVALRAITDFGVGTIIIYPDIDPFLEETEEEGKSNDDWDHLLDFNIDDIPLTSSSAGGHLTQEEAAKEAIAIRMSQKFALLEEERPIIETMAYNDKYNKILDEVWKDNVELDGKIVKEEEAVKRIMGEALKEKDDPEAFIFPIRLEGQLRREDMKKVDRGITMINHTQAEAIGILTNVLCQVGVTTLIAKFLILDIPIEHDSPIVFGQGFLRTIGAIVNTYEILFSTFDGFCHQTFRAARSDFMRNAESDSDDEENYQIKRNKFGAPIYGPKPAPYLNYNDPDDRSLAIQTVTNPFQKISVWKKAVSFFGSLPALLKQVNWKPDYKVSYTKEEEATSEEMEQTMGTHDEEAGSSRSKRLRQETMEEVLLPQVHHEFLLWEGCHRDANSRMGCDGEIYDMLRIKLRKAGSDEEIFTSVAWIRAFNINEPIYAKLCHDDEHFNAQDYWLSISREENLGLSRSHISTIKNPNLRVIHKMITYGLCQRTTGYDKIQKNDLWILSMFDAKHQNGHLDTNTLKDLIDFDGKLIPEDPQPSVPRVGIPRPPRAYMQDLYDRMGRMEIRQEAIERMEYSVPMQGSYNPPGYAQPQYDQYYQQYPPPPPQYHQQQQDDDE
ncbi:hypothetical protein Tco_0991621 [Tanacetum coccineum]|uniref:Uncharacterized protein n=1 Tax=Tanacetum coccineum TaxID=301880 RepID=A0ABQ5F047_9ASTR